MRDLFRLTAEVEGALALAGGGSRERVALMRGAQFPIVRTQVRAILAKAGAADLREPERLLARLGDG